MAVRLCVFTCATVEVLIVDNQTGSEAGVVHLVAVRVRCCCFTGDGGTVRFLSSGPKHSHTHTQSLEHTLKGFDSIETRGTCLAQTF